MYLLRKIFINFRTVHGILYHSLKYLWNTYVSFFHYLRNSFISYFTVRRGLYSLYHLYHPLYHSLTTYGTLRNTLVRYCATNGVLLTVIFLIAENFCQSLYNLQPGNLYQLFYFLVMSCQCNLFKTKIN